MFVILYPDAIKIFLGMFKKGIKSFTVAVSTLKNLGTVADWWPVQGTPRPVVAGKGSSPSRTLNWACR